MFIKMKLLWLKKIARGGLVYLILIFAIQCRFIISEFLTSCS